MTGSAFHARAGDFTPREAWNVLAADPRAVLVDVRTSAEWVFVGLPDLTPLGRRVVALEWTTFPDGANNPRFLAELEDVAPKDAQVMFLCRSGHRSVAAADAAARAGWMRSFNVLDGFEGDLDADGHRGVSGWRAEGLPWRQS
ncbi:Rhodanese-related sulfurtransferase [Quadrisphaera granulorum]|uniref:Rhodanese-related sulfurtransferase n=1 Tax=Quadrisphaera granulorum TaxID=317664 RepID=A0A315ZT81_9ACTN|nr:rhodanese-like domain-containing protein [Quadrisphaera granulorum]PWJ48130.1 rhodanese-related sulfurtransferase [Quadrisphaera granulorum]SZE98499.1 Rhodanese-related sulfurtransferase [Quadrisphaera granulorum]